MVRGMIAVVCVAMLGTVLAGCAELREPTDRQREVATCLGSALVASGRGSAVSAIPSEDVIVIGFTLKRANGQTTAERIRVLSPKDDADAAVRFTTSVSDPDREPLRQLLEARCSGTGLVPAGS